MGVIKFNQEPHPISWLTRQNEDGKLNMKISIQRDEVWDNLRKSNFIVSLMLGVPIESLLFEEAADDSYIVLDGKQRTLTVCQFIKKKDKDGKGGGFALSSKIRIKKIGSQELAGITFEELPKKMQDSILNFELPITVLRTLNAEDRATVFFMRNQAQPLTKMDLSLVQLGDKAMETFNKLLDHNFIKERIKLTTPAKRKHDDLAILLQYMILNSGLDKGFSGKAILDFCELIKSGKIAIPEKELTELMDYLDKTLDGYDKRIKKVHVPVLMAVAQRSKNSGFTPNKFRFRLELFFDLIEGEPECEYMLACKSGSAKKANVQRRIEIMSEVLEGDDPE
jgi:hypothetical protein